MNDIRLKFEEIWPVPEGVYWWIEAGEYNAWSHEDGHMADEWNARLDTFTRCQETTAVYVGIIHESCAAWNVTQSKNSYCKTTKRLLM